MSVLNSLTGLPASRCCAGSVGADAESRERGVGVGVELAVSVDVFVSDEGAGYFGHGVSLDGPFFFEGEDFCGGCRFDVGLGTTQHGVEDSERECSDDGDEGERRKEFHECEAGVLRVILRHDYFFLVGVVVPSPYRGCP